MEAFACRCRHLNCCWWPKLGRKSDLTTCPRWRTSCEWRQSRTPNRAASDRNWSEVGWGRAASGRSWTSLSRLPLKHKLTLLSASGMEAIYFYTDLLVNKLKTSYTTCLRINLQHHTRFKKLSVWARSQGLALTVIDSLILNKFYLLSNKTLMRCNENVLCMAFRF